jgi:hypothetical protein
MAEEREEQAGRDYPVAEVGSYQEWNGRHTPKQPVSPERSEEEPRTRSRSPLQESMEIAAAAAPFAAAASSVAKDQDQEVRRGSKS